MKQLFLLLIGISGFLVLGVAVPSSAQEKEPLKAGMVGLTTSHVPAFAKVLNDKEAQGCLAQVQVTAGVTGGMKDNPASWDRREKYTEALRQMGAKIYDSVEEMLPHVDVVMVMSVDGRPHREQACKAILAGKPVYIDKPMAGSLADVLAIFQLAEEHDVSVFSSSSLRYSSGFQKMRNDSPYGAILGCVAFSPCKYEEHHPDLFWYGVHGVETLFTIMGTGCREVKRTHTEDADLVTGVWDGGRIGSFRGSRKGPHSYGAFVWGEKGSGTAGSYEGYKPLVEEICRFFTTGVVPVEPEETIEIFAFMEAADESRRRGGETVTLQEVIEKAEAELEAEKR